MYEAALYQTLSNHKVPKMFGHLSFQKRVWQFLPVPAADPSVAFCVALKGLLNPKEQIFECWMAAVGWRKR